MPPAMQRNALSQVSFSLSPGYMSSDETRSILITLRRFTQIEAWMLHADCNPETYWFAKSSLNRALEICTACETDAQSATAGPADFAELVKVKHTVSGMLRDRLVRYTEHWKKGGRAPPPSEEEWYEIEDAREPGEGEEWSEAIVDQDGEYVGGPVTAWPFKEPTGKQTRYSREPLTPAGSRSCSVC